MRHLSKALAALAFALVTTQALWAEMPSVEIPFEKFVLANGLRVIVHEDRKAPVVGVAVWYHVGSKNEPPGKTGFAHLFEHLMFEGTENYDAEYTEPFERVGTVDQNGTTWFDRTNYFQTVPTPALEMALWMESERMGHLLGAVTQQKLDQERAVVKSEKSQGDNQPYGRVGYRILEGLFPPGHPYRHDSIGSMDDLDAASLDDVHDWFRQYYGAANAVLVLAGDISPARGRVLAERYFGDIDPGPPLTRMASWVPVRTHDTLEVMFDDVPHVRTYHNWVAPGRTQREHALLQVAAHVLGAGKNSRLYQALILETGLAVDVSVDLEPHELASLFNITVTLSPDAALEDVNGIITQELDRFFRLGPGEAELQRARSRFNADLVRGLEQVGGFTGKAAILASGELYDGRPDFYQTLAAWINEASSEEIRAAALDWLADGRYRIDVLPVAAFYAGAPSVDRSAGIPAVGELPALRFPAVERATLRNGIEVVMARRDALPLVDISVRFDAGFAADRGEGSGTSAFTLAMLEESTATRSALEMEALAASLGAEISTDSDLDSSRVNLAALKVNLEPSIELLADVVRNPAFAEEELERLRSRWLAGIDSEWSSPVGIALRTLPPLLYGPGHAYGIPFTGSGVAEVIGSLDRDDLETFYRAWLQPGNARIFVVGDVYPDEIIPALETHFGNWRGSRRGPPKKSIGNVPLPETPRLYLAHRPASQQSLIMAAHLMPPTGVEDDLAIRVMDDIFGGGYSSRLNRVIRIEKGWAYGAYTYFQDSQGQRFWAVYAPVERDSTADAMAEIASMIEAYRTSDPPTGEELDFSVSSAINSLPGQFETNAAVMAALLDNARFQWPDDYVETLKPRYDALGLDAVQSSAATRLQPERLTWVVVGDLDDIGGDLHKLAQRLGIVDIQEIRIGAPANPDKTLGEAQP